MYNYLAHIRICATKYFSVVGFIPNLFGFGNGRGNDSYTHAQQIIHKKNIFCLLLFFFLPSFLRVHLDVNVVHQLLALLHINLTRLYSYCWQTFHDKLQFYIIQLNLGSQQYVGGTRHALQACTRDQETNNSL